MKRFLKVESPRLSTVELENSEGDLAKIIKITELSQEEVLKLFDDYRDISNRMTPLDQRQFNQLLDKMGISKSLESLEFRIDNGTDGGIIVKLSESVIQKEIQSILFRLFDINRDGKIDFGEFLIGFHALTTNHLAQRAAGIFHVYDVNGDGVISRDDMLKTLRRSGKTSKKILNASSKYLKELGKERTANISKKLDDIMEDRCLHLMVEEIFSLADLNGDGSISLNEFILYVENNPETLRMIDLIASSFKINL